MRSQRAFRALEELADDAELLARGCRIGRASNAPGEFGKVVTHSSETERAGPLDERARAFEELGECRPVLERRARYRALPVVYAALQIGNEPWPLPRWKAGVALAGGSHVGF